MEWKACKLLVLNDGTPAMLNATWREDSEEGWEDILLESVNGECLDIHPDDQEKIDQTLDLMDAERMISVDFQRMLRQGVLWRK